MHSHLSQLKYRLHLWWIKRIVQCLPISCLLNALSTFLFRFNSSTRRGQIDSNCEHLAQPKYKARQATGSPEDIVFKWSRKGKDPGVKHLFPNLWWVLKSSPDRLLVFGSSPKKIEFSQSVCQHSSIQILLVVSPLFLTFFSLAEASAFCFYLSFQQVVVCLSQFSIYL